MTAKYTFNTLSLTARMCPTVTVCIPTAPGPGRQLESDSEGAATEPEAADDSESGVKSPRAGS